MNDSAIATVSEASRREKRKLFLEIASYLSPIIIIVVLYFIDNFINGMIMGYADKIISGG